MQEPFNEKTESKDVPMEKDDLKKGIAGDDEKIDTDDAVALAKDGLKMHPQPTSDPLDPLNWSSLKKHGILGIVMAL
jgi:hypothetical protein